MGSRYGDDLHLFGLQDAARGPGWGLSADGYPEEIGASEEGQSLARKTTPGIAGPRIGAAGSPVAGEGRSRHHTH